MIMRMSGQRTSTIVISTILGPLVVVATINVFLANNTGCETFLMDGYMVGKGDSMADTIDSPSNSEPQKTMEPSPYIPAPAEKYILEHMLEWGWDSHNNPEGCMIWNNSSHPLYQDLQDFLRDLDDYQGRIRNFPGIKSDIRDLKRMRTNVNGADTAGERNWKEKPVNQSIEANLENPCDQMLLGSPAGVKGIFAQSGQLSRSSSGYVEPLTTPMRHPRFCSDKRYLMDMNYMVHDFQAMCEMIQSHSKTVLIDMGASSSFHDYHKDPSVRVTENPVVYLLRLYDKFGIKFDHIYAFEATFASPDKVYENLLPKEYLPSYHWINTGVQSEPEAKLNPLHSILSRFNEEDFVVVKLDIDTARLELPLARQLL